MMDTNPNTNNQLPLDVRVYPQADKGNLLAFASVKIADCFVANGIKVITGENGTFVSMPRTQDAAGEYHDICYPANTAFRQRLNRAVLDSYQAAIAQSSAGRAAFER